MDVLMPRLKDAMERPLPQTALWTVAVYLKVDHCLQVSDFETIVCIIALIIQI